MAITSFFNQIVGIRNRTSKDLHGKQSYGALVSTLGRFEKKRMTIATSNREREPIDGIVFFGAMETVEVGDLVVYQTKNYKVMAKEEMVDGKGQLHHFELKVQTWLMAV